MRVVGMIPARGGSKRLPNENLAELAGRLLLAYTCQAGLIHHLGVLVERQAYPEKLAQVLNVVQASGRGFCEVETEILGADHQTFGAGLAGEWRFPRSLQAVLGYHHQIEQLSNELYQLVALVHLGDIACCELELGFPLTCRGQESYEPLLKDIGLAQEPFAEIGHALPEEMEAADAVFS